MHDFPTGCTTSPRPFLRSQAVMEKEEAENTRQTEKKKKKEKKNMQQGKKNRRRQQKEKKGQRKEKDATRQKQLSKSGMLFTYAVFRNAQQNHSFALIVVHIYVRALQAGKDMPDIHHSNHNTDRSTRQLDAPTYTG